MSWTDPCSNCGAHRADCDCGNWNNYKNINSMQTGLDLVAQERKEQIEKHGYTIVNDQQYQNNELVKAALFCTAPQVFEWPQFWSTKFRYKIEHKSRIQQLVCAASFLIAEIDRELNSDPENPFKHP